MNAASTTNNIQQSVSCGTYSYLSRFTLLTCHSFPYTFKFSHFLIALSTFQHWNQHPTSIDRFFHKVMTGCDTASKVSQPSGVVTSRWANFWKQHLELFPNWFWLQTTAQKQIHNSSGYHHQILCMMDAPGRPLTLFSLPPEVRRMIY